MAWCATRPPAPPALPRRFQYILAYIITSQYIPQYVAQYILLNLNTSNTSFTGPAIQPTVHPAIFQYITYTSWHDSSTSFNTSCSESNTSDTSFNTFQYILPVFNTSDVLEDVLDVLTSNTSFNTSQYILQIFEYIPIHPACIRMYWMY